MLRQRQPELRGRAALGLDGRLQRRKRHAWMATDEVCSMSKVYIPARSADDWRRFLAEPGKQWRWGHSARTLACCWQGADGFPAGVHTLKQY